MKNKLLDGLNGGVKMTGQNQVNLWTSQQTSFNLNNKEMQTEKKRTETQGPMGK